MRYLLAILLMFVFCGATYEKVSDTKVNKITVKEITDTMSLTLNDLKAKKASLEASKASHNKSIDEQISEVDKDIAELKKLEIIEIDASGNIIE